MENEVIRKIPNPYLKMIEWAIISIVIALLPLLTYLFIQRDIYFAKEVAYKNISGIVLMILFFVVFIKSFINSKSNNKIVNLMLGLWIFWFALRSLRQIIFDLETMIFIIAISISVVVIPFMRFNMWRRRYLAKDNGKYQYQGFNEAKESSVKGLNRV